MKRMGMVIRLRADHIDAYKAAHREVWPAVLDRIADSNIRNYTIFLREPENLLFGVMEYHGVDFESDMARMAENRQTQEWWALMNPCQEPFETRAPGSWWAEMEEVFHVD